MKYKVNYFIFSVMCLPNTLSSVHKNMLSKKSKDSL